MIIISLVLFITLLGQAHAAGEEIYNEFNQFCIDNFGAQNEPLVYQTFGNDLTFVDSGFWLHESRNSAAIAFETNLPAKTRVEYGLTTGYGQTTEEEERFFYLHLHYLTGLQPDTIYHYRFVATDERGNQIVSADRQFQTHSLPQAIPIPGNMQGPPYVLDQPNAYFILTQNISSDTRGITILATNVTVDLNGHTITYDQGTPLVPEGAFWSEYLYSENSTAGIQCNSYYPLFTAMIVNGIIIQGQNNGQGSRNGDGFNPILSMGTVDVAGVTADSSGDDVSGILIHWGAVNAHHNIVLDRGTVVTDRDVGIQAISGVSIGSAGVHHNLIKRARHRGIYYSTLTAFGHAPIYANEIYQDSYATNAFGIMPTSLVYDNKIFGTGYHVVAIGFPMADVNNGITVRNNFIFLQGVRPNISTTESEPYCSVNGIRLTQYGSEDRVYDDALYEGNTIIVKGREGCNLMRGVQFYSDTYVSNLRFRNNTIKTEVQDDVTYDAACVVPEGLTFRCDGQPPLYYEDNLFITNSVNVLFGDEYGVSGCNHQFRNNTLRKFGSNANYKTIKIGISIYPSINNRFIDSTVEGGADLENNLFERGTGRRDYAVGHSLYLIALGAGGVPLVNENIELSDNTGTNYLVQTDDTGLARIELLEYAFVAPENVTAATKIIHQDHKLHIDGFENYTITTDQFVIHHNDGSPVTLLFISLGQSACPSHDANGNGSIDAGEIGTALNDWISGTLNMQELIQLITYFKRGTCA